jgi:chromosome partitioning protein
VIVLFGSRKGGCGKSTTAVNVCAALANRGNDVVLVDADPLSTAAKWVMDRDENTDLSKVHCIQKYDNIRDTLIDLNNRYEYVIVDAPGKDSRELRTGMTAAHKLIVPFKPSNADLDTLEDLQRIIVEARDFNPGLEAYGLMTMVPTNPVIRERKEASEYLDDYPEISLLAECICERKVYRDALPEGRGVVEMTNSKAASEINALIQRIF